MRLVHILVFIFLVGCSQDTNNNKSVNSNTLDEVKPENSQLKMDEEIDAYDDIKALIPPGTDMLPEQHSEFTSPVKQQLTQEELIKRYKVKTIKESNNYSHYVKSYSLHGELMMKERIVDSSRTVTRYTYEFNENDELIENTISYNNGEELYIRYYEYNEKGNLSMWSNTDENGETTKTYYYYDTLLSTRIEQNILGLEKEFYDNRELRVRLDSYDEKGKLIVTVSSTYNQEGWMVSENSILMGSKIKNVFEYNEKGQVVNKYKRGLGEESWLYQYNKKGLSIRLVNKKGSREDTTHYQYTFY